MKNWLSPTFPTPMSSWTTDQSLLNSSDAILPAAPVHPVVVAAELGRLRASDQPAPLSAGQQAFFGGAKRASETAVPVQIAAGQDVASCGPRALSPLPLQNIESGSYGQAYHEGGRFTFTNKKDFVRFYKALRGAEPSAEVLSKIDFRKSVVVAVVRGECSSSGYGIAVESARAGVGVRTVVQVSLTDPTGMALTVMTNPYHIVTMPKTAEPVQFLPYVQAALPVATKTLVNPSQREVYIATFESENYNFPPEMPRNERMAAMKAAFEKRLSALEPVFEKIRAIDPDFKVTNTMPVIGTFAVSTTAGGAAILEKVQSLIVAKNGEAFATAESETVSADAKTSPLLGIPLIVHERGQIVRKPEENYYYFDNQREFAEFYFDVLKQRVPGATVPQIDFDKFTAVVLFPKNVAHGQRIEVKGARLEGELLILEVTVETLEGNFPQDVPKTPYALVLVQKIPGTLIAVPALAPERRLIAPVKPRKPGIGRKRNDADPGRDGGSGNKK